MRNVRSIAALALTPFLADRHSPSGGAPLVGPLQTFEGARPGGDGAGTRRDV